MNWTALVLFGVLAIGLIIFLVRKNLKDEKKFEEQLKNDYRKPKDNEGDIDTEEALK